MVSGGAVVMMVSGGAVVMMESGGAVVMMVSGGKAFDNLHCLILRIRICAVWWSS